MTIEDKSLETSPSSCCNSDGLSSVYSQMPNDDETKCNVFLYKDDKLSPHAILNRSNSSNQNQSSNSSFKSSVTSKTESSDKGFSQCLLLHSYPDCLFYKLTCTSSLLNSPICILRLILLFCSFLSLICVVSCQINRNFSITKLPSAIRLHFHVVTCVVSIIITIILLFTEVTNFMQILYRTSFNLPLFETILKAILTILLIISTSLVLHLFLEFGSKYKWVPVSTQGLLLVSVIFGFLSVFCAFILSIISWLGQDEYKIFREESRRSGNEYLVT